MNEEQVFQTAQEMFLKGSGRKQVIQFLETNGIAQDQSNDFATKAYQSVKDERKAIIAEATADSDDPFEVDGEKDGMGSVVLGGIIAGAGVVATMSSDTVWYGAILVGGFMVIKGLIGMSR